MKVSRLVPSGGTCGAIALLTLLSVQPSLLSEALGGRLQDKPRLSSWKRLSSGDIEAIGDVPDGVLRRAFDEISSFRSAFVGLYPAWRVSSPVPTRILVFPDLDAFRRFSPRDDRGRPMQNVGGYFEAGPDVNILAIGANQSSVVFHEFAHYLLNRNFHSLPLWLHEGLAEFLFDVREQLAERERADRPRPDWSTEWRRQSCAASNDAERYVVSRKPKAESRKLKAES